MSEDIEKEKQKLKDLLDAGFIFEDEYRQRLGALGVPVPAPSPLSVSASSGSSGGYGYQSSYTSSSPSYSYSSSPSTGPLTPFQPVDKCECEASICSCGLSIPSCLAEDHRSVCARPTSDNFTCPVGCGRTFFTRGACADHLHRECPINYTHCYYLTSRGDSYVCSASVVRSDIDRHFKEHHDPDPVYGSQQLPDKHIPCPNCRVELRVDQFVPHKRECPEYLVCCSWCKADLRLDEVEGHTGSFECLEKAKEPAQCDFEWWSGLKRLKHETLKSRPTEETVD